MIEQAVRAQLGFGASGAWAQSWFPEREAIRLIHQAHDHGVRHFDSAGFYANGVAERRLGLALKGRHDVSISTKVGTRIGRFGKKYKDFSAKAMHEDLMASLKRLQRDHVDVLYLHGPDYWIVEASVEFFAALKAEGLIKRSGVCGEGEALARSVTHQKTDVIMGVYNLLNQDHAEVFRQAKTHGITIVAIAPLAQAFYRRGFYRPHTPADVWAIARAVIRDREEISRADKRTISELHEVEGLSAPQVMLDFVLRSSFVDVAMTTTTKPHHLEASLSMVGRQASASYLEELRRLTLGARP